MVIGRRRYPVKQVGLVLTRQDHRDFTADEVTRAMARLGFTRHASEGVSPLRPTTVPDRLAAARHRCPTRSTATRTGVGHRERRRAWSRGRFMPPKHRARGADAPTNGPPTPPPMSRATTVYPGRGGGSVRRRWGRNAPTGVGGTVGEATGEVPQVRRAVTVSRPNRIVSSPGRRAAAGRQLPSDAGSTP
ncbi:SCO5918 family protein [Yinghuangia aomiensis]